MNGRVGYRRDFEGRGGRKSWGVLDDRRGFTLTELMIAVAIIAVLASFMAPSVMNYVRRNQGQSAAAKVSGIFQWARSQAMNRGQVVFLRVRPGGADSHGTIEALRSSDERTTCGGGAGLVGIDGRGVDFERTAPNMMISAVNINGNARVIAQQLFCFTPDGRVLNASGQPFSSSCDGVNARIFVQQRETPVSFDNPLGSGDDLDVCQSYATDEARTLQKNGRSVGNFYVVQVPYNGAITVVQ